MRQRVLLAIVLAGIIASLFNGIRFIGVLANYSNWSSGSYIDPALTALGLLGGLTCLVLAVLALAGLVLRRAPTVVQGLVVFALFAYGAVAGLVGPFIHASEVDITPTGIRQSDYSVTQFDSVRFYNVAGVVVTVCFGQRSVCTGDPNGLAPLLHGLTLEPGDTARVRFTHAGTYAMTIIDPPAEMSVIDAILVVKAIPEDNAPPF